MVSSKIPQTSIEGSLSNHFLIAMPGLKDSLFSHSVTYICDHSENGAMGIVINHTLDMTIGEVFDQLNLNAEPECRAKPILAGGPVNAQQGFVLHRDDGQWNSTLRITDEICLTASRDIVEAMADNRGPAGAQFALGYAGWDAGQLEEEISANSWLTMPAESGIIFDVAIEERWGAASKQLGVDLNLISGTAGHA